MLGALAGDTIGSVYEFHNTKIIIKILDAMKSETAYGRIQNPASK